MCTGNFPFEAKNEGALIRKILRPNGYTPVAGYSPALCKMVHDCLTFSAASRPGTQQLLANTNLIAKVGANLIAKVGANLIAKVSANLIAKVGVKVGAAAANRTGKNLKLKLHTTSTSGEAVCSPALPWGRRGNGCWGGHVDEAGGWRGEGE